MMPTICLHLAPSLGMSGVLPPYPHISLRGGANLSARLTFCIQTCTLGHVCLTNIMHENDF